jgi:hypothetical protein
VEEMEGLSPQRPLKSPKEAAAAGVGFNERGFNCADPRLLDDKWTQESDAKVIEKFMMVLAVCHTIVPEGKDLYHSFTRRNMTQLVKRAPTLNRKNPASCTR